MKNNRKTNEIRKKMQKSIIMIVIILLSILTGYLTLESENELSESTSGKVNRY